MWHCLTFIRVVVLVEEFAAVVAVETEADAGLELVAYESAQRLLALAELVLFHLECCQAWLTVV